MKQLFIVFLVGFTFLNAKVFNVTVTAYSSTRNQTDRTPFIAAWGNKLSRKHKYVAIAVSRDLLHNGLRYKKHAKLIIGNKTYNVIVLDKMNKRWRKRVDLYFYTDYRGMNRFGKKHGKIIF